MTRSKVLQKSILILAIFAMIVVTVFCLSACGGLSRFEDNPSDNDIVIGNGGLSVQKGDYLYFTNGYVNTSDIGETNNYGNITISAIYRAKLDNGKVTEANIQYYEDGCLKPDEKQEISNLEIFVPKVAGFEYSNLFIFGDYLYYTTPNHLKDSAGTVQSTLLNFYRTKLDRSGGQDLLYSSNATNSNVYMTMYQIGDTVYQIIQDGTNLVVVYINGNKFESKTISENVNEVALANYENSTDIINDIDYNVYFTENFDENIVTGGTIVKAYNLASEEVNTVYSNEGETYELKGTSGNYLFYTKSITSNPGQNATVYAVSSNNGVLSSPIEVSAVPVASSDAGLTTYSSNYVLVAGEYGPSILYTNGSLTFFKSAKQNAIQIASSDILTNMVEIQGDTIYYIADSNLNKLTYTSSGNTSEVVIPSTDTPKADIPANFDVDGARICYFVQYTENYYLHYVDYSITVDGDPETPYSHFVGELVEADYVEVPDEDEHTHE